MYYYTVGKQDYVNTDKIYRIINRDTDAVTQIDFNSFLVLASKAISQALKISI